MKKFIALLLALVFMAAIFALPAGAVGFEPPFEISGKAAYIVNTDTNIIVYEKNSEESLPAASTTKLMTAILVMEQYQDQLDTVTGESSAYIRDFSRCPPGRWGLSPLSRSPARLPTS